jgi:hypothetical protein
MGHNLVAWLLRMFVVARDRGWRPARRAAVRKLLDLLDKDRPRDEDRSDDEEHSFDRDRAKKWRKFEDGKKSSTGLGDGE